MIKCSLSRKISRAIYMTNRNFEICNKKCLVIKKAHTNSSIFRTYKDQTTIFYEYLVLSKYKKPPQKIHPEYNIQLTKMCSSVIKFGLYMFRLALNHQIRINYTVLLGNGRNI